MDPQTLKTILPIALGVVFLAFCFFTYLNTKTWRPTQVVMLFLVFMASIAFWYLAAATLKVENLWRTRANELVAEAEKYRRMNAAIEVGTDDETTLAALEADGVSLAASIDALKVELHKIEYDRGRVWRNTVADVGGDGTTTLQIPETKPHGIESGMTLFIFEQGADAGGDQYLGEFKVTGVDEDSIIVQPAMQFDQRELNRLTRAGNSAWTLYKKMPIDQHALLAGMDEQELRAMFPEGSIQEYLKDWKPPSPEDPPERIEEYTEDGETKQRYTRRLRDYEVFFKAMHKQRYLLSNNLEQLQNDLRLLTTAEEGARRDVAVRQAEADKLKQDLAHFQAEIKVVEAHRAQIDRLLAYLTAQADSLRKENVALATDLIRRQTEMADQIESSTPAPAAPPAFTAP